jgi:hypothetical protein
MKSNLRRLGTVVTLGFAPLVFATVATPGIGNAIECGYGTVFDPPSNTCVAAPAPPPPPPPPPAWNGDVTPYFSVGICAPIPFVSVCAGI